MRWTGSRLTRSSPYQISMLDGPRQIGRAGLRRSQRMQPARLSNRRPYPLGSGRHVEVTYAIGAPERIDNRVHHRRTGADGAGFTRTFDAENIGRAAHIAGLESERGSVD